MSKRKINDNENSNSGKKKKLNYSSTEFLRSSDRIGDKSM